MRSSILCAYVMLIGVGEARYRRKIENVHMIIVPKIGSLYPERTSTFFVEAYASEVGVF